MLITPSSSFYRVRQIKILWSLACDQKLAALAAASGGGAAWWWCCRRCRKRERERRCSPSSWSDAEAQLACGLSGGALDQSGLLVGDALGIGILCSSSEA